MILAGTDPALLAHLEKALIEHRRWSREQGIPLPAQFVELLDAVLLARSGQKRPTFDVCAGDVHDAVAMVMDYESVARALQVSERSVRRLVASGQLRAVEIAGCRRIRLVDLREFVERL